jgi:hypothetical protein
VAGRATAPHRSPRRRTRPWRRGAGERGSAETGDAAPVWIDWEYWHEGIGAHDLATFRALECYPERRERIEDALLVTYAQTLSAAGVTGHGSTDLAADYRIGHLQNIARILLQQRAGSSHGTWWGQLKRRCLAFEDRGCAALR